MDVCNYVGLLQEKCGKMKISLPCYKEIPSGSKTFTFTCSVGELTTEGNSVSKKGAKQIAAKLMISKLESVEVPSLEGNKTYCNSNAVSKLFEYSLKEKKAKPLFSEKPEEGGMAVIECSFDGYVGVGKGPVKKVAKEMSADQVLNHFNIYSYFENLTKADDRVNSLKTPVTQLNEVCQMKKFKSVIFKEEIIFISEKERLYEVICTVGDNEVKSTQNPSKREAKNEAASLMLNILDKHTPVSSPLEKPIPREQDKDTTPVDGEIKCKRPKLE